MITLDLASLRAEAEAMRPQLIAERRDLHAHPELAFQEFRTAGIVARALGELGYEVQTGVGKTGVVGVMDGGAPGRQTLLVRFDMDALPIDEVADVPFRSTNPNTMHACGHDAHTAIGLGVARMLARHRELWQGTVKFVFQPAEENGQGAAAMIDDGVLFNPAPTRALSMHVWSTIPSGTIGITPGPTLAAIDIFDLTLTGRGAHGASPHEGADPIVAAAQIITALQSIVSRNVSPLDQGVVSVGAIHGGSAHNIIPDSVVLKGTLRAFRDDTMRLLHTRIREIVEGIAAAMGVSASLAFSAKGGLPATVNDPAMAAVVRGVADELVGTDNVIGNYMNTVSEDAALFLQAAPGAYAFVGAGNVAAGITEPHHSPRFQIDEDALPLSVALMTASAVRMLAGR
jgi:amidohydrolase